MLARKPDRSMQCAAMFTPATPAGGSRPSNVADRTRRALLGVPPLLALALAGCAIPKREIAGAMAPFSTASALERLPRGWEDLVLRRDLPRTDYQLAVVDGRRVLRASGHGASGVRCRLQVAAREMRKLQWSWCTREVPPGMSVGRSETDDSPARVAIGFHGDEQRLSARDRALYELVQLITGERLPFATLMYVWDGQLPPETVVGYARTARIQYVVVESGPERAGRWIRYERDLVDDFRSVFGGDPESIESVGVMTDGDDLQIDLETCYGDIRLSAAADGVRHTRAPLPRVAAPRCEPPADMRRVRQTV